MRTDGNAEIFYCFSETGYLNTEIWSKILGKFAELWRARNGDLVATLLLDNLGIHHSFDPLLYAFNNFVRVQFLPPNTSHFLQPLDDLVFAIYKSQLALLATRLANALRLRGMKASAREIITAVSSSAVSAAFKQSVIGKSFANCNLWPFQPDKILAAAKVNIGEIIKPEKVVKGSLYNSRVMQQKVAAVYVKKANREMQIIADANKSTTRVRGMVVKYGTLSSVETIIRGNEERLVAEKAAADAAADAAHEAALEKIIVAELKLREKEEKAEEAVRKKAVKAAEKAAEAERKRLAKISAVRPRESRKRPRVEEEVSDDDTTGYLCNVMACHSQWSGANDWHWCEHCLKFGICKPHWLDKNSNGRALMADHERRCGARKKPRKE